MTAPKRRRPRHNYRIAEYANAVKRLEPYRVVMVKDGIKIVP